MPFGSSGLGAAVEGVGVTELLEHPALFAEMRAVLVRHRLLVLDAPGLTEQQQLTLGRLLGECQVHPTASLPIRPPTNKKTLLEKTLQPPARDLG